MQASLVSQVCYFTTNAAVSKVQITEYDRLRQFTTLNLHYDGTTTAVMVKKKETMAAALETVFVELGLAERGVANVHCFESSRVSNCRHILALFAHFLQKGDPFSDSKHPICQHSLCEVIVHCTRWPCGSTRLYRESGGYFTPPPPHPF